MILDDRNLETGLAGEQAKTGRTGELSHVGFFRGHLQHTADAASVFGWYARLEEFHVLHGVWVDDGEQAEQMGGIVHRAAIEEDEVLVGGTPSHVVSAGCLSDGSDSG